MLENSKKSDKGNLNFCSGISLVEVMVAVSAWTLSLVAIFGLINYSQLNIDRAAIVSDLKQYSNKALEHYLTTVSNQQLYVNIKGDVPRDPEIFGGPVNDLFRFTIHAHPINNYIILIEIQARGPKSTSYTARGFVRITGSTIENSIDSVDSTRTLAWCALPMDVDRLHFVRSVYEFDSQTNITDMSGFANYIVVSTDDSSKSRPDTLILKATSTISDSGDLDLVSSFDVGLGVTSIHADYPYLFLGTRSAADQIRMYDIRDPTNATLLSTTSLRTITATTTPVVRALAYRFKDKTLHIGAEKWSGREYSIINVSSTTRPIQVDGLEISGIVKDVFNFWPYTFISTGAQNQLIMVRTDNPGSLSASGLTQTLSPSGWQTQEGSVLRFAEGKLWWGRTVGGFNNIKNHELFELNVLPNVAISSTSTFPVGPSYIPRDDFELATSTDVAASVRDLIVGGKYAIALTSSIGKEIMSYQFDDSGSVIATSSIQLAGTTVKMWCNANNIFVALNNPPRIVLLSSK